MNFVIIRPKISSWESEQIAKITWNLSGFFTMNGCGDNTRNVIGCPLSYHSAIFNANLWAQRVGKYFVLPTAAFIEIFEIDPKYLRDRLRKQDTRRN